jgi:hypothetical protein
MTDMDTINATQAHVGPEPRPTRPFSTRHRAVLRESSTPPPHSPQVLLDMGQREPLPLHLLLQSHLPQPQLGSRELGILLCLVQRLLFIFQRLRSC